MIHTIDWHSGRVGSCARFWNYAWYHTDSLLRHFERKLLSGGVIIRDCLVSDAEIHELGFRYWLSQSIIFRVTGFCEGNPPVTGGFPSQRSVTSSFDGFFDLRLTKRLSMQSRRRWFETRSRSLWRHCHVFAMCTLWSLLLNGCAKSVPL